MLLRVNVEMFYAIINYVLINYNYIWGVVGVRSMYVFSVTFSNHCEGGRSVSKFDLTRLSRINI